VTIKLRDMTQQLQMTTRMGVGCQRWQQPVYVELLPRMVQKLNPHFQAASR